jgi:hypothetical protein
MQIMKSTFKGFQKLGVIPKEYEWTNPKQNKDAGFKIVEFYSKKYDGDVQKIAAAYYSGEDAVNSDGSINRHWKNNERPNDPTVGQYVDKIVKRVSKAQGGVTEIIRPDAKMPASVEGLPWWGNLTAEQQHRALTMAKERDNKEQAVATAALKGVVQDHMAEASTKGFISQPLTAKSFGTDVAGWQEYQYLVKAVDQTTTISSGPVVEQQAKLDAIKPSPEGLAPGVYADRFRIYENAVKQVVASNKARTEDPVSFARTRNFSTGSPIATITDFSSEEMVTALGVRGSQSYAIAESGQHKLTTLDKYEAAGLKKHIDSLSPQEANDWIKQVTGGVRDKNVLKAMFRQASPNDSSLIIASDMALSTHATPEKIELDMAAILHGRSLMNASLKGAGAEQEKAYKNAALPANGDAIKQVLKYSGTLNMKDNDIGRLTEAVTAHYIGTSMANGQQKNLSLNDIDVKETNVAVFNKSIEAIMGKGTKAGSTNVLRPYGMDESSFMNNIQGQVDVITQGEYKWGEYSLQPTDKGYLVSIVGRPPFLVDPSATPYRNGGHGQGIPLAVPPYRGGRLPNALPFNNPPKG